MQRLWTIVAAISLAIVMVWTWGAWTIRDHDEQVKILRSADTTTVELLEFKTKWDAINESVKSIEQAKNFRFRRDILSDEFDKLNPDLPKIMTWKDVCNVRVWNFGQKIATK